MSGEKELVIRRLLATMEFCRYGDIRFNECFAEARKRFNREVREKAIEDALAELPTD